MVSISQSRGRRNFGQRRPCATVQNRAAMRRLPAAQPLMVVKGRFLTQPTGAPDPQETFAVTVALRQVSKSSSLTARGLSENYSATAAVRLFNQNQAADERKRDFR